MGEWLKVNGDAVYGTRVWKIYGYEDVRFTVKEDILYVYTPKWPENEFTINIFSPLNLEINFSKLENNIFSFLKFLNPSRLPLPLAQDDSC